MIIRQKRLVLFCSTDTLWDLAADEVRARERRTGHEQDGSDVDDNKEDSHAPCERTVFFMGSKTGVKHKRKLRSDVLHIIS